MSIRRFLFALLMVVGLMAIPLTAANADGEGAGAGTSLSLPYCGITWGSGPKSLSTMGTGEIDTVRTGQHSCYDRVVIDIDGPPAGYDVRYVSQVTADGSGLPVTVPGAQKLQLIVRHPSYHPQRVGQSVANVRGYQTLRSVVYAGSFEGQTTYGVGVRARLPFRVFTIPGGHGRIVVDIAHKW